MPTTVVPRYVRRLSRIASSTLVAILFLGALPESASAVSSWSPTLLVNTESFQTIDSGDGTTDIELRFGSNSNTIKFLNTLQKFQFSKSLSVIGSISGSSLTIDGVANFSGAVTVKGATTLKSTVDVTGDVTAQSNLTINSDAGATDANLTFGNASGNQTIKYLNTAQKFEFSKDVRVIGNISGSTLTVDGAATVQTLNANGNIAAKGALSGSTFYGANLGSCNGVGQKLLYNYATGKFQCGTDLNGSFSTGNVLTIGDARFVKKSGDTMTGALNVRASISGATLTVSGQSNLSGALTVKGATTLKSTLGVTGNVTTDADLTINTDAGAVDALLTFGNASGNQTIKYLNTAQKFEFSKDVRVIGNISGSTLTVDGAATVQTLNANGNIAAKGALSGSTFYGANLGSCNGVGQKLLYNYTTGKFQCGTDLNGSFSTGNVLTIGDARFVKKSGDTMTGALNVRASISGATLTVSGQSNLSGALTVKGATTLKSTLGVTGNVTTDADLTINTDAGAVDALLTFGNASGNQTIKYLNTAQKFEFSKDVRVIGNISGSTLTVDGAATVQTLNANGNIAAKGALSGSTFYGANLGSCNGVGQKLLYNYATGKFQCGTDLNGSFSTGNVLTIGDARFVKKSGDTMTGALNVRASISGATLTVSGQSNLSGALTVKGATTLKSTLGVTGNVTTDADLTINTDAGAVDALLTFGNASGNQTIKYLNTAQKFEFSKDVRVIGNISGSTLTVDGNVTLHGVTYNAPSAQGAANTFLKNDGAGNLTWTATSVPNSSGSIMSMHPDYPGAIYFASGASMIGQLTMSGGTVDNENSYAWTSSRGTIQSYWISVRGRVPDNFSSWDAVKPVEFRYKTGVASAASNALRVLIKDTAGAYVPLTGHTGLANTAWTTANIRGPEAAGTWTPKGYFTVYVQVAATNAANAAAYASYLNMNYETTIP